MSQASSARLRVVEIAQGIAGPALGKMLADWGHDVVKCEPPDGDWSRHVAPLGKDGVGLGFVERNAGKRSIALDFQQPDGLATLKRLLESADVLITDLGQDRACTLGLTRRALRLDYPGLIAVSLTQRGADKPHGREDSLLAEAAGGLATMIGEPSQRPLSLGGHQAGFAGASAGFLGLGVALVGKSKSGLGEFIDVVLTDLCAFMDWKSDVVYADTAVVQRRSSPSSGKWRMLRARDGWVGVIYQPDQWSALVDMVGQGLSRAELADVDYRARHPDEWWPVVAQWVAQRGKLEVYQSAQQRGLPFGYVADMRDLLACPQLRARGFLPADAEGIRPGVGVVGPLIRGVAPPRHEGRAPRLDEHRSAILAESVPAAAARRSTRSRSSSPLEGILVLDFGTITAGAAAARHLADYGATVIKIESADRPDRFRHWKMATLPAGARNPALFESNNAGKLGLGLDLKNESDRAALHALAARAHVVVENFSIGVPQRLGIDAKTLLRINPALVYLSLSSHGQQGPMAGHRSYGSTLDLLSGLASMTGYDADHPIWSSADVNYPDQIVALFGAAAVAMCLGTGKRGIHLDISQREVTAWTLAEWIADCAWHGTVQVPAGNQRAGAMPHEYYRCAGDSGWIAVSCHSDAQRRALARLLGDADLPGFDGEAAWLACAERVHASVQHWLSDKNPSQALAALRAAGVPCEAVLDARTRAADPGFVARQVFLDGAQRLKGYPFRLSRFTPAPPAKAPRLGEHTGTVRAMSELADRMAEAR